MLTPLKPPIILNPTLPAHTEARAKHLESRLADRISSLRALDTSRPTGEARDRSR